MPKGLERSLVWEGITKSLASESHWTQNRSKWKCLPFDAVASISSCPSSPHKGSLLDSLLLHSHQASLPLSPGAAIGVLTLKHLGSCHPQHQLSDLHQNPWWKRNQTKTKKAPKTTENNPKPITPPNFTEISNPGWFSAFWFWHQRNYWFIPEWEVTPGERTDGSTVLLKSTGPLCYRKAWGIKEG